MDQRLAPPFEYRCLLGGSAFCALPFDRDEAAIAASGYSRAAGRTRISVGARIAHEDNPGWLGTTLAIEVGETGSRTRVHLARSGYPVEKLIEP